MSHSGKSILISRLTLGAATILCLFWQVNPALALFAGIALSAAGLIFEKERVHKTARMLMAWAIVGLGATINLPTIFSISAEYFFVTISGILLTLACTWVLGRYLSISQTLRALIGSGTAICGASAIAAVGTGIKAKPEEISVALAVVLIFNAVALLIFPPLGHLIGVSNHDFAVWAGLAIHDTSSVVGAAIAYSSEIVEVATTVKLARAVWIAPLVFVFCKLIPGDGTTKPKLRLPWFIWGYLVAATVATFLNPSVELVAILGDGARRAFSLGLFLTGCAVNVEALKKIGAKPFLLGLVVWVVAALWSLYLI